MDGSFQRQLSKIYFFQSGFNLVSKEIGLNEKEFFFFLLQKNSIIPFKHFTGTKIPLSSLLRYHRAPYSSLSSLLSPQFRRKILTIIQYSKEGIRNGITKKNKLFCLNRTNNAYTSLYPFHLSETRSQQSINYPVIRLMQIRKLADNAY